MFRVQVGCGVSSPELCRGDSAHAQEDPAEMVAVGKTGFFGDRVNGFLGSGEEAGRFADAQANEVAGRALAVPAPERGAESTHT